MRIVVDIKNLALYNGGIAHWFAPLLAAWIRHRPDAYFLLLGPEFRKDFLPLSGNWEHVYREWPQWLPRPLRHPYYDNLVFPRALKKLKPDLVMSPYHDVRMPFGLPSVITVHDLCLGELACTYPCRVRFYYQTLLKFNLRRAIYVLTVSETTRDKLIRHHDLASDHIGVVFNTPPQAFLERADVAAAATLYRRLGVAGRVVLYSGGSEYRKNVERLVQAFTLLVEKENTLTLVITGDHDHRWQAALAEHSPELQKRVIFAGRLSDAALRLAYAGADAVVYPSLCEGFGRVCLEAMVTGSPLACSDLPVTREVSGSYGIYFDPRDVNSIAAGVNLALSQGRRKPYIDIRFHDDTVRTSFLSNMDRVLAKINKKSAPSGTE
jgi:glycosyltransferase involved in cell wall biosynthesis